MCKIAPLFFDERNATNIITADMSYQKFEHSRNTGFFYPHFYLVVKVTLTLNSYEVNQISDIFSVISRLKAWFSRILLFLEIVHWNILVIQQLEYLWHGSIPLWLHCFWISSFSRFYAGST